MKEALALAYKGPGVQYPAGCSVAVGDGQCPAGKETKFFDFSSALTWFLRENDYIG